jgi:aryl-alcohol dehydrogenase-like predicted oxidoreductase
VIRKSVLGEALEKYPRDSYYLATKFLIGANPDYKAVFEEQLAR